ncbi:MAG: S26 family signal peptidase, partial [Planctomycetota bacterium]
VLTIAAGQTALRGPGRYKLRFANVDDQLLLWVDGSLATFDGGSAYDAAAAFGRPAGVAPRTSDTDPGDLSPVGIGVRGADVSVSRLQVHRDLYYIADSWDRRNSEDRINVVTGRGSGDNLVTDYPVNSRRVLDQRSGVQRELYYVSVDGRDAAVMNVVRKPELWPLIGERLDAEFVVREDQFFVMGDNSPQSSDSRLWARGRGDGGVPGGPYLEQSLLTGKAVCVYWPHALVSIPTPKRGVRIPIVPNLGDIRLVR